MNLVKRLILPRGLSNKLPPEDEKQKRIIEKSRVTSEENSEDEEEITENHTIEGTTEYGPVRNNRSAGFVEISKPSRIFRVQRKLISLTIWNVKYQGRNITKETVHDNILRYYKKWSIRWMIVAREFGSRGGGEHLHALILFEQKIDTIEFTFFNKVTHQAHFADLQVHINESRTVEAAVAYTIKDGDYITFGDAPIGKIKAEKPLEIICRHIKEGSKTLAELRLEFPSTFVIHGRKIDEHYNRHLEDKSQLELKEWNIFSINQEGLNEMELGVLKWLFENLPPLCCKGIERAPRPFKQEQLYIWGRADSYKSSLCLELDKYFNGLPIQDEETFYDHLYRDPLKYGFLYFEEFSGNKTISHLNQFIQGGKMNLKAKGNQFIKNINYPCIFLSNSSPEECYRNAAELHPKRFEAFTRRLKVIQLPLDDYNKNDIAEVRRNTLKTLTERIRDMNTLVVYPDRNNFLKDVHMTNAMKVKIERFLVVQENLQYLSENQEVALVDSEDESEEEEQLSEERKNEESEDEGVSILLQSMNDSDILSKIATRGHRSSEFDQRKEVQRDKVVFEIEDLLE